MEKKCSLIILALIYIKITIVDVSVILSLQNSRADFYRCERSFTVPQDKTITITSFNISILFRGTFRIFTTTPISFKQSPCENVCIFGRYKK